MQNAAKITTYNQFTQFTLGAKYTMEQAKHTPILPLHYEPTTGAIYDASGSDGRKRDDWICWMGPDEESKDRAEFIVRAANSHAELLEALEKMVHWYTHEPDGIGERLSKEKDFNAALDAISRAKGTE
jgi:uncharacterized protein (DUF1778 family)